MLVKIDNPEVMTVKEAKQKYVDNWFWFVSLEDEDVRTYKSKQDFEVKVLYLADSKLELVGLSEEDRWLNDFRSGGIEWGNDVDPYEGRINVGRIIYGEI